VEYVHLVLDVNAPNLLLYHPLPQGQVLLLEGVQLNLEPFKGELCLLVLAMLHLPRGSTNGRRGQTTTHGGGR
jgi:hypothetical protein